VEIAISAWSAAETSADSSNSCGSPRYSPVRMSNGQSAADVRLDGDEIAPDADDGDAGDYSETYIRRCEVSASAWPRTSTRD
jgi:hypothetical protein